MAEWICFNGKIFQPDDAVLLTSNRGFRYGDGLFESIKIENNIPVNLDLHLSRLNEGCQVLGIPAPSAFQLSDSIKILLQKFEKLSQGRLKISVYRESEGNYSPVKSSSSFLISISDDISIAKNLRSTGICPLPLKMYTPFSKFKTLNALPYIYASLYMKEKGWDDVIILNQFGRVCEALSSNVFWKTEGVLYTIPVSEGCIEGVMRKVILQRNNIVEKTCTVDELLEADNIYVSNAIQGFQEVVLIRD
ncbi:MAG: aminotransferase class IV [Bacteroidetes bacterium]|nr:aminotransferase class IV [Bacteroidota bacterium]